MMNLDPVVGTLIIDGLPTNGLLYECKLEVLPLELITDSVKYVLARSPKTLRHTMKLSEVHKEKR
jgi:hypothetical protein